MTRTLPPRVPRATFQPRFTLMLLYLAAFFLLYALLLVAPELARVARTVPAPSGPATEEAAREAAYQAGYEAARRTAGPRLPVALAAAVVTTGVGAWTGMLPGLRRR